MPMGTRNSSRRSSPGCTLIWFFIGLVVIGDFYVMRVVPVPTEADTVLIVYSDAVLACALALQSFKAVARRNSEFVEAKYSLKLGHFLLSYFMDWGRQFGWTTTKPDSFGRLEAVSSLD